MIRRAIRTLLRGAGCAGVIAAGALLGGCQHSQMLRQADSELSAGKYEQALQTYRQVRKESPIKGYRARADKGIAEAGKALAGGVSDASRNAAAAGQPGRALLYEARAARLTGNKDYSAAQSEYAQALLHTAAIKLKIEARDNATSPVMPFLAERLAQSKLLRVSDDPGQTDAQLKILVQERPLINEQEPIRKTVSYVEKQVPGPNPAYAEQERRLEMAQRQAQDAAQRFQHQQTLQFATEARAQNNDNVRDSQRRYAWIEAERLRKVSEAAGKRAANEDRKLRAIPQTIDTPHYEAHTFDARRYSQVISGELNMIYQPAGAAEQPFDQPLRMEAQDEAYSAQPIAKLKAKAPNLPTPEDMRYKLHQQAVENIVEWLGRVEAARLDELERNAKTAGRMDPVEAAVAVLMSGPGTIQEAQAKEYNAMIKAATGVENATALLGIAARSPSIVDVNPNKDRTPEPKEDDAGTDAPAVDQDAPAVSIPEN